MTEDEADAKVAELFGVTKIETVNGHQKISDEMTLDQMEREEAARRMEEACGMFLTAERRFQKLNSHPDKVTDPDVNVAWWESLEQVYEREKVVWRLFVGPQPSMADNKLYAKFRELLLKGSKLSANA
jgi:hypothetical protein